jgi:5-methylcytosine-specific restriction protein A
MEMDYTTQIPKLSDINRERRQQRRAQNQRRYKMEMSHSGSVSKFYDSSSWKNLRLSYLMEHPLCELSLLEKRVIEAQHVHHLIKWADQPTDEMKWRLLLDPDNLIALTAEVHQFIHYSPDKLTGTQLELIKERKEKLFDKYLCDGLPLVMTSDLNR